MMQSLIKTWKTNRRIYTDILNQYNPEELNKIPAGFNNNIIWNAAHIIVAQQGLVYRGAGQPMHISNEMANRYKPGTKPEGILNIEEIEEIKTLLTSLIDQTEKDLEYMSDWTYNERTTSTGFHLGSIQDALEFNNYHEGLHLGYILSLRKFLHV
jgi:hypothetical protein